MTGGPVWAGPACVSVRTFCGLTIGYQPGKGGAFQSAARRGRRCRRQIGGRQEQEEGQGVEQQDDDDEKEDENKKEEEKYSDTKNDESVNRLVRSCL